MKKLLIATAMLLSTSAFAEFAINGGSAKSPTSAMMQAYSTAHGGVKFKIAKDCEAAVRAGNRVKDSIYMLTSDQVAAGNKQRKNCSTNLDGTDDIVFMVKNKFKVCRLPGTTVGFDLAGATIGRASVHPIDAFVADFNRNNKTAIKGVALNGSKSVLAGVLNGDIDWGVIANDIATPVENEGRIVCDYDTTVAGSSSGKSLNDAFKLDLDGFVLRFMFLAPNASPEEMANMKAVANGEQFQAYLNKGGFYSFTTEPTAADLKDFTDDITALENY